MSTSPVRAVMLAWRLGRPTLLGVTAATACLGLIAAPGSKIDVHLPAFAVAVLLYHYAGVVINDVMDVDVDAMAPRRGRSPLVTGEVPVAAGLRIGAACLIGALLVAMTWLRTDPGAVLVFTGSIVCMLAYNLVGKRVPVPLLMDLVQGLAWGLLVLWAGRATRETNVVAAAIVLYMTQVNAVHGGVRDAAIDRRAGRFTTALLLGVAERAGGGLQVPRSLRFVAYSLQAILLILAGAWVVSSPPDTTSGMLAAVGTLGILITGFGMLRRGLRPEIAVPDREIAGARHIALTFQAIAYLSAVNGGRRDLLLAQGLGALLVAPLLAHTSFRSRSR
ncbi:MAG: UbiA family prenyltransferase [Actinoplanes sp.]